MMYLVVMPYSWGRGETIEKADKNARKEGGHGRKKVERIVFCYNPEKTPECYIGCMGQLCWSGEKPMKIEEK